MVSYHSTSELVEEQHGLQPLKRASRHLLRVSASFL